MGKQIKETIGVHKHVKVKNQLSVISFHHIKKMVTEFICIKINK